MSLEIKVYVKEISDELIPQIVSKLNDFEMNCEVDPDFTFNYQEGFLPFKFKLTNPPFEVLKDKDLLSGFEIYINDFDYNEEFSELTEDINVEFFASSEIDEKLKDCKKEISFIWNVADSFEFRFASLTSVILTDLTNGVCCYPADDIWYENATIVEDAWEEIKQFESSLNE